MNGEFNWWLLIVGLIIGAALVWLVLADSSRRDSEVAEEELRAEATWIASTLAESDDEISPEAAERVLRLHRAYLASPPPDEIETWPPEADDANDPDGPDDPEDGRAGPWGDDRDRITDGGPADRPRAATVPGDRERRD